VNDAVDNRPEFDRGSPGGLARIGLLEDRFEDIPEAIGDFPDRVRCGFLGFALRRHDGRFLDGATSIEPKSRMARKIGFEIVSKFRFRTFSRSRISM